MYSLGLRFDTVATRLVFFIFLLVPLLFVGSILLTRTGTIGSTLYKEIQILSGIGFYVFLGAAVLALCLLCTSITHTVLPTGVAWFILVLSLAAATAGFIQSHYIKIVKYDVTLPNAPIAWEGKTAVLVSDTHFGLVNYKNFSDKVVRAITALQPDFVLHAGDFYDGPAINTTPLTDGWKKLTDTTPVFFAPGNHEEYGNYAGLLDSLRKANVEVLDNKKVVYDGVQIAGITYHEGKDSTAAKASIDALDLNTTQPTILINHPPTSLAAAHARGVDLQVSGHTHNGQFWPMTYLIRRIYGIYYHGQQPYESMSVITSSGIGTFGPPFRLFNTQELVVITFKTK